MFKATHYKVVLSDEDQNRAIELLSKFQDGSTDLDLKSLYKQTREYHRVVCHDNSESVEMQRTKMPWLKDVSTLEQGPLKKWTDH